MTDSNEPDRRHLPRGRWLSDRPTRARILRVVGLAAVVALVAGALAVRFGGSGSPVPTLYDRPDTVSPGSASPAPTEPHGSDGPSDAARDGGTASGAPVAGDPAGTPADAGRPAAGTDASARDPAHATHPVDPGAGGTDATGAADGADAADADAAAGPGAHPGAGSAPEPEPFEPEPDPVYVPATPPDGWADPTEPSPLTETPVADSLRVPKPEAVRGVYVGSWTVGSRRRLSALLDLADATEINAFVVDVKDVTGEVSYRTQLPLAVQVEADRQVRIADIRALLDTLRAHEIYPIARIVAFKDPLLSVARPEWSVERTDGTQWEDDNEVRWVDSFNRSVWDYNIELAREAVALGFGEVQWDYVRFPDVPRSYALDAVYPARDGRTKTQAIREFLGYAADRIELDVPITADVFGITTSTDRDVGIGQVWEAMSDQVDVLLPMVYPSHYPDGSWGFPNPNAAPYQIVKLALEDGVERSDTIPDAAAIRPWLQAFSLGEPEYGPMHIRAQIDATYDAGLTEWLLWHPAVRYPVEAFTDANGIEPWFAGMGEALYEPDRAETTDTSAGDTP